MPENRLIYCTKQIIKASKTPLGRILVFTGARQTGKTTLARSLFPQYAYLSIEDPVLRSEYSKLSAAQWRVLYPTAILDEVQKKPELIESIKAVYDQWSEPRYVLLGSSQLLLLDKVRESLAGRCTIIELFPLTVPELATSSWDDKLEDSLFQRFLQVPHEQPPLLPSFKLYHRCMHRYAEPGSIILALEAIQPLPQKVCQTGIGITGLPSM
jgi:predicted AAA+ superfamily ATPase